MSRSKVFGKLLTFIPARRGDWVFKASVYQDKYTLMICINTVSGEFYVRHFTNQKEAVDWLEYLLIKDNVRREDDDEEESS